MSYKRAIVAVDVVSDAAEIVLARARQVCTGAEVTAVHVVDEGYLYFSDEVAVPGVADLHHKVMQESAQRLEAASEAAGFEHRMLLEGHAANEIHRYAEDQDADLVVMGAHGRHGWRLLLGSTANAVLHGTVCDVLCVHVPEDVEPFREVLVAVDSSVEAVAVIERALEVAEPTGARVSLISVIRPLEHAYAGVDIAAYGDSAVRFAHEAEEQVVAQVDALADSFGIKGERLVRRGHPAEEIHAAAEELSADLVVVGTHGRHGFSLLLGSTANAVLHGAKCDILAVRVGR